MRGQERQDRSGASGSAIVVFLLPESDNEYQGNVAFWSRSRGTHGPLCRRAQGKALESMASAEAMMKKILARLLEDDERYKWKFTARRSGQDHRLRGCRQRELFRQRVQNLDAAMGCSPN